MAWPNRSSDPTRRPRNSIIAAGLLVAVASVLIGFHGTTMVLSAVSPVAEHETSETRAAPDRLGSPRPAHSRQHDARNVAGPAPDAVPPSTGVAAAAKAKALAEMEAMEPGGLEALHEQAEEPAQERRRPRRFHRAPRPDKHKVY
jgi:hypothetical protein